MSAAATPQTLYRHLLRELRKSSISPRTERNPLIASQLRTLFAARPASAVAHRDAQNVIAFLKAQRLHKELLDRYNPLHDQTQDERVRATARRVGLEVPLETLGQLPGKE